MSPYIVKQNSFEKKNSLIIAVLEKAGWFNTPVALPKIIPKPEKSFSLLKTPLDHFNNHIMEIIYTITSYYLHGTKYCVMKYIQLHLTCT